jgi:hypothetical protein
MNGGIEPVWVVAALLGVRFDIAELERACVCLIVAHRREQGPYRRVRGNARHDLFALGSRASRMSDQRLDRYLVRTCQALGLKREDLRLGVSAP